LTVLYARAAAVLFAFVNASGAFSATPSRSAAVTAVRGRAEVSDITG
jgi:hypothetical protein